MLDVCDPRVIRALLEKYGFHFSKAKGQNFLTQRWVPQRIAQEAGIDCSTGVLEIGPGFGRSAPCWRRPWASSTTSPSTLPTP